MSSEAWVYIVYDSWTTRNAYFSSRDSADEFAAQELGGAIRLKDRYQIYSYQMDSGQWN